MSIIYNELNEIMDTLVSCRSNGRVPSLSYMAGNYPPNYQVPATIGRVHTTRYGVYFINPDWIGTSLTINWRSEWHWK